MTDGDTPYSRVVAALWARRSDLFERVARTSQEQFPELHADSVLHELARQSLRENLDLILRVVRDRADPAQLMAPPAALTFARIVAQMDVRLSVLLRAYRRSLALVIDLAMHEAQQLPPEQSFEAATALVAALSGYVDRLSDLAASVYEQERDRWVTSRGVLRQHWVSQLLTNPLSDRKEAEAVLGYRLAGTHLGVEAWIDDAVGVDDVAQTFEHIAGLLQEGFTATGRPLTVPTGRSDAQLWFPVAQDTRVDSRVISGLLERSGLPVRIAIGAPEQGVEGFRRTILDAGRTRQLAVSAGPVTRRALAFGDIAAIALLTDDPVELGSFVHQVLGDLAADEPKKEVLRETLREFLATNRSYVTTAERLGVRRNTVHYRVQQITERYGVVADVDTFDIQLALNICRWRGPAALSRTS